MTKAESRKWTIGEEISENAVGRRTANLVSGNGRAVAVEVARGSVDADSLAYETNWMECCGGFGPAVTSRHRSSLAAGVGQRVGQQNPTLVCVP